MRPAFALCLATLATHPVQAAGTDPRLREVLYDAGAVQTVPVKRGVVTLVVLDPDEAILEVAAGRGGDCAKAESAWCIAAQPGGRTLFVKARPAASAANNVAVVTDRRSHSFSFVVLADQDPRSPVYRLRVRGPLRVPPLSATPASPAASSAQGAVAAAPAPGLGLVLPRSREVVADRLGALPQVLNTRYSVSEGRSSEEILPSLVFDDGRFTYLRFAGNREVPAVFHVRDDGGETLVNAHMQDDLLVVDRVSRRLVLRAGDAVVGVWNDAFDVEGMPPLRGTTVPGVERVLKPSAQPLAATGVTR